MERTLVWYQPRNADEAKRKAAEVGGRVRSAKGWLGYVEEPADRVIVDPAAPEVLEAYRDYGARVEWLSGEPVEGPEPEAEEPSLPAGFEVVRAGPWYKVVDADGNQVGNAKRSEAEAVAQVV